MGNARKIQWGVAYGIVKLRTGLFVKKGGHTPYLEN